MRNWREKNQIRLGLHCDTLNILKLVVKLGEKDIPGLAATTVPHCLGPKSVRRVHKLFDLSKEDDVIQPIVRKPLNKECKKLRTKASRIQRVVTSHVLQHQCWSNVLKK
jgi:hypothetical protein